MDAAFEPTTAAHVSSAEDAVNVADEAVEAAGLLLAEAYEQSRPDLSLCLAAYRRAKADRAYAVAVAEAARMDHHASVPA